MNKQTEEPRRVLTRARAAADAELERMVADGVMTADTAYAMATDGFIAATRVLSELHASGLRGDCITQAFERELHRAQAAGDQRLTNSSEFTLAVWGGMQEDLVAYLVSVEPPADNGRLGICGCGREKQPGENHWMCYPGME